MISFAEHLCNSGIEEGWRVDCGSIQIVGLFHTYVGMTVKDGNIMA